MFTRTHALGALAAVTMLSTAVPAAAQDKLDIALIAKGCQRQFWQADQEPAATARPLPSSTPA